MRKQNLIRQTVINHLEEVRITVTKLAKESRTAIARRLCERFSFYDAKGEMQISSCLQVLKDLESSGRFALPAARRQSKSKSPRRLNAEVDLPKGLPERVDELVDLRLVLVKEEQQMRCWNELIIRDHPQGHRPLVGRQIRYLVECESGMLGALGFSSAALQLKDRDDWIGWTKEQREAYLDRIVCLSRFLIRPQVNCLNLASKILGMAVRQISDSFHRQYGYHPWLLESFVDTSQYSGVSYRAANWLRVGQTRGRGRQDRASRTEETIKDVYLYVLDKGFRKQLGVSDFERYPALDIADGLTGDWGEHEFGNAPLGDGRLTKRLITIATEKGENPQASYLHGVKGDRSASSGFYRFIDMPAASEVTMDNILQPHRERTLQRMNAHKQVLCIHDTTDLNYSTLSDCEDLGVIGKNQTDTISRGLSLHTSLAVTENDGLPLGILNAIAYARELKPRHKGRDKRYIPLEDKETKRWLTGLDECRKYTRELPETRVIHVMDREGDFFDLFDCWNRSRRDDVIIRAKHNRRTDSGVLSLDLVAATESKGTIAAEVPRRSSRPIKGSDGKSPARKKRAAILEVRYMPTQIKPPKDGLRSKEEPVNLWLLHLKERPSEDTSDQESVPTPIEWYLLTSIPIEDIHSATRVLDAYVKRWRIEEWHRILKTGCRVEKPAHQEAIRLKRMIAINMVIAWRIFLMTLLGREAPDLPPEVIFSELELKVLRGFAKSRNDLDEPENLERAVVLVARLGGYLDRKNDPPPGATVLWRGLTDLAIMVQGAQLLLQIE